MVSVPTKTKSVPKFLTKESLEKQHLKNLNDPVFIIHTQFIINTIIIFFEKQQDMNL